MALRIEVFSSNLCSFISRCNRGRAHTINHTIDNCFETPDSLVNTKSAKGAAVHACPAFHALSPINDHNLHLWPELRGEDRAMADAVVYSGLLVGLIEIVDIRLTFLFQELVGLPV